MGNEALVMEAGDRIAQMVFFECDPASQYNGKYQGSTSGESKGWK
jgi:deoxycytidine triphosphate deaminase